MSDSKDGKFERSFQENREKSRPISGIVKLVAKKHVDTTNGEGGTNLNIRLYFNNKVKPTLII